MKVDWKHWRWKIFVWPRLELIYLLGGIPKEHINTVHYRNIESITAQLTSLIVSPTSQKEVQ